MPLRNYYAVDENTRYAAVITSTFCQRYIVIAMFGDGHVSFSKSHGVKLAYSYRIDRHIGIESEARNYKQ